MLGFITRIGTDVKKGESLDVVEEEGQSRICTSIESGRRPLVVLCVEKFIRVCA